MATTQKNISVGYIETENGLTSLKNSVSKKQPSFDIPNLSSEKKLITFLKDLYHHLDIVEYSPEGDVINISKSLLKKFGNIKWSLINKNVRGMDKISGSTNQKKLKLKSFWKNILNGETITKEIKVLHPKEGNLWFKTTFVPIENKTGKVKSIIAVPQDITLLKTKKTKTEHRNRTLEKNTATLLELTKNENIQHGNLIKSLEKITEVTSVSLNISRVSVWRYDETRNVIKCVKLYNARENVHTRGAEMSAHDYPRYFDVLNKQKIINVSNAQTNRSTKEFVSSYLKPLKIKSMLDIPFFMKGKLVGVICCEQQNHVKKWSAEDVIFVKAMSNIVVLSYKSHIRRKAELKIKKQKSMIEKINQSLEKKVKVRTSRLEKQNQYLAEYAFINAHLLRGPLCRIKGLVSLLNMQNLDENNLQILDYLTASAKELDDVIMRITDVLHEGRHFDRDDFWK
jgi:hypothetical protein